MGSAALLASGNGSNFQAIAERLAATRHTVSCLICDRPTARVVERAERMGVPSVVVPYSAGRESAEARILAALRHYSPNLVVLAGFMKILPESIVREYEGRIVNIHPSLLPRYPGLRAIERSYESGDSEVGVTVHFVDNGVDTGPIIEQRALVREPDESLESLEERIHAVEHQLYPDVVISLLDTMEERTL